MIFTRELRVLFLSLLILFLVNLPVIRIEATKCNISCGDHLLQYPFGFSPGCQIPLNCSADGQILLGDFPVQSVNADTIKIFIQATCHRSLLALHRLYGPNYAPTSRNAILLQNCSSPAPCLIPSTMVYTRFETLSCDEPSGANISCYTEDNKLRGFIDFQKVLGTNCRSLLSSISAETFNETDLLEVQVVELGWWLDGQCDCHKNANCTEMLTPHDGRVGFRCQCHNGFAGDGFAAGSGCRKVSSHCNPARYLSGHCGGTTRVGVLVGGVLAGALLMVSMSLVCCFIQSQWSIKASHTAKRRLAEAAGITIPIYAYKEMEKATNSFSDKQRLGTGAYGTVYAGKLKNDLWVAIKRMKHGETDSMEQVMNEIKLLSSVNHPNLVRLLGCSIENGEEILVYEFMPNGTLYQHLQGEKGNGLTWPVRLTIATETAQAIAYLHSAIHPPIYHRDIKSTNILLDYNFRSKVADFGLSRLGRTEISHISTAPQGTPGYLDPQYHQNFHLSDKSDVYSFGVLLIEIISGLKVVDFSRPHDEVNLAALATDRIGRGQLSEIIDPLLDLQTDPNWTLCSIHKVAELAFRCLAFHRDMRPSMTEVARELEQIMGSRSLRVPSLKINLVKATDHDRNELMLPSTPADGSINSLDHYSPVSVQDPWSSEQSSPSSNSLLNSVIH